jgi:hypothetical protein
VLWWVLSAVLLGAAGIGVLATLTLRLYHQVRRLGRDVAAAGARIAAVTDDLQRTPSGR